MFLHTYVRTYVDACPFVGVYYLFCLCLFSIFEVAFIHTYVRTYITNRLGMRQRTIIYQYYVRISPLPLGNGECGCNGNCTCNEGFSGDICECRPIEECRRNPGDAEVSSPSFSPHMQFFKLCKMHTDTTCPLHFTLNITCPLPFTLNITCPL